MKSIILASIIFWGFFTSFGVVASAQHTTIVNLASMPKWQVQKSENVSLSDVRQWGVQPSVDLEYGVTKVEIRTYGQDSQTLQALVEKAPDPSSAYGLFTFYQNEKMQPAKGMKLAVIGPQQALMSRGTFFVRVMRPPKMSEEDFRSALITIAGAAPSSNSLALLPPSLPPQGIIQGSIKYVLGPDAMQKAIPSLPPNLVGFQQGAEVQSAEYNLGGHQVDLIFISYPTYSIARIRYKELEQNLAINQKSGPGAIYGKVQRSYVLLVHNAQSKEVANSLMGRLTIEQQVSWDQAPPGKPVTVQMFHLILGNIMLVLFLVGLAVLAGILLFVSRRMAARWFPHWDWAQGYEDSIIQLNLK
jgi:Family of unknown function (DUF6599)